MAINLGNDAIKAISELRGNPHMDTLITALSVLAQSRIYASIDGPIEQRVQQTAHSRGIYEVVEAMHAAYAGLLPSQLAKPVAPKTRRDFENV
jgi:hypothetical protein